MPEALRAFERCRVPADALLVAADGVRADESLLTGESVPVEKGPGDRVAGATVNVGPGGRWLLDPINVTIDAATGQLGGSATRRDAAFEGDAHERVDVERSELVSEIENIVGQYARVEESVKRVAIRKLTRVEEVEERIQFAHLFV